jgi:hypothetical protein
VFALLEKIQECRKSAQIEGRCAKIQQVVMHSHEFGEDRSQILAARRQFDIQEFLDGMMPRNLIRQRRQIVHAINDGDVLVKIQMFTEFLETAVQVTNIWHRLQDPFAVQRQH